MHSARFGLLVFILLLSVPGWARQAPQQASAPQPASDPQAVAVVQAAITALGGATAIGRAQSWTFTAQMRGPVANDQVNYTLTTQTEPAQQIATRVGIKNRIPMTQSFFVPVLVGRVLKGQSEDQEFSISSGGSATVNSKTCSIITFSILTRAGAPLSVQDWCFDSTTSLPVRAEFRLPADVGSSMSPRGVFDFADYRSVSGVMYPFFIGLPGQGGLPEIIVITSVNTSGSAVSREFNSAAGDLAR
jgi:hypothetical protein